MVLKLYKRNPNIAQRVSQNSTAARSAVCEQKILPQKGDKILFRKSEKSIIMALTVTKWET